MKDANGHEPDNGHEQPIVVARGLGKQFKQYATPAARLAEWLSFGALRRHTRFTALQDINFTVSRGQFFGIIGPNGSGKSTLLKILTGVLSPTFGSYHVAGRVTSLLELGTGFSPELSGRNNLINSGRLLGFDDDYVCRRLDAIVDFAELREHIDVPIKYYSSGMVMRLAFALFAHVEPDVFIVDEALSVGDVAFSRKCFGRLDAMRAAGCTLLFVSHDLAAVRKYCDQVMFMDHGRCKFIGSAVEATDVYVEAMSPGGRARGLAAQTGAEPEVEATLAARAPRGAGADADVPPDLPEALARVFDRAAFQQIAEVRTARIGTRAVRIAAIKTTDEAGKAKSTFTIGETMHCHLLCRGREDVAHSTFSLQLVNRMGVPVWGTNHALLTGQTTPVRSGTWLHATFAVRLDIGHDEYSMDVGWGDASGEGHVFDRITGAASVTVLHGRHTDFIGVARLECETDVAEYDAAVTAPPVHERA